MENVTPIIKESDKKLQESAPPKINNFTLPSDDRIEFFQEALEKKGEVPYTTPIKKESLVSTQSPLQKMGDSMSKDPLALYEETRKIPAPPTPVIQTPQNEPGRIQSFMGGKYKDSPIKPLRTYRGDVEEAMKEKKTSVVTIAIAQKKREEHSDQIKNQGAAAQNVFVSFLTIVIIVAAIGSVAMFLFVKSQQQKAVSTFYKQEIIPTDKEVVVNVPQSNAYGAILEKIRTLEIATGEVVLFRLLKEGRVDTELSAQESAVMLDSKIPGNLLRSFSSDYMLGVYRGQTPTPFFIVKTDSFEIAFPALLSWEKSIPTSLGKLFSISTTTGIFDDKVVKNKDTRILKNEQGETVMLYAFLDSETIMFAGNEVVFSILLDQYFNSKFVR